MGATFIALSADHVISKHIIKTNKKIRRLLINIGESTNSEVEQSRQEKLALILGIYNSPNFRRTHSNMDC